MHSGTAPLAFGSVQCSEIHMLFVGGAIIVLIALVLVPRLQVGYGTDAHALGWMSQQWLDEYGSSHRNSTNEL